MRNPAQSEILLETGTNELEIMEFTIGDNIYGINVAKVREILVAAPLKPMQNAHPSVEGIFKPRDFVITVLDLAKYLGLPPSDNPARDIYIISHFNNMIFGFHVHGVVGIDRISWTAIQKPDKIIYGGHEGVATGIAEYDGRLITILDFEKIVAEINPQAGIYPPDIDHIQPRPRIESPILVVEDSMMLSHMIVESLNKAGYVKTVKVDNGQEAWDYLNKVLEQPGRLTDYVACVVTDIEMPQMDGHRLTKLIKEHSVLKRLPVILFSSLINEQMRLKGRQVGADAQVTKPSITTLVNVIDQLTGAAI